MGSIKIHEIAKKLGLTSKEVLKKAQELGMEAKSHLSGITEDEASKLEKSLKPQTSEKPKEEKKDKEKTSGPVIIRRAVIISDEEVKKQEEEQERRKKAEAKKEVGFIDNRKKDFNIVYRNKQAKPLTVSELFGLKKEEPKKAQNEEKPVAKPEVEEPKQEDTKKNNPETTPQNKQLTEKRNEQRQQYPNNNRFDSQSRPNYDRNNRYNNGNNNNYRQDSSGKFNNTRPNYNSNRPFNNNKPFNNQQNNNMNGRFNNNNNQGRFNNNQRPNYNNNRRPLDERGIEKNIKDIMSADIVEKESVREYANRAIDKQKLNRPEENKKKTSKTRRNDDSDFSSGRLKDLKQESKLSHMFNEGSMLDYYDLSDGRNRKNKKKTQKNEEERTKQKIFQLTDITIPEIITVKDLAAELKKTSSDVIKKLLGYGIMATINNEVDFDTAFLIAGEFGVTAHKKEVVKEEDILFDDSEDKEEELISRPPVIVVMGHVDHGKTSLLDAVRSTNVIEGEAGGITQAIGAYKVEINGREITFLDTPGHEAFTAMRARGAQVTDIAILVVAANDGVMPQTIEAINHAKAANIPIIVAVNKIDVEGADVEKVKRELTEYGLVPEEWGGDTIFVPISAKKKQNIDTLLEMVLLVADMQDLKVNPNKQAKGTVIEARLDKSKGPIATMLVQRGCLDVGDTIVVGSVIGRIRNMKNDKGQNVKKAGPSTPVEISGLTEVPEAGETFYEVKDEKAAKHLIERRKRQAREKAMNATSAVSLDDLFSQIEKGNLKQLNLIVKADVQGSVEAVKQAVEKLSNDEVKVKVIHANVGAVNETDVTLAKVSNAIIIAFNVRPDALAKSAAEKDNVEIKMYSVIYNAIEDIEAAMKGMLDPVFKEVVIGTAEVRQTFKVSSVGTIAGCYVTEGKIARNSGVRVIRDNIVVHEGKLVSLKRFKDDAKEVAKGYECGIQIEDYNDIKEGDIIEAHIMEEVK